MPAIETVAFCRLPHQLVDTDSDSDVQAEIKAIRLVFRTANAALDEKRKQERRHRKVVCSSYRYRDPKSGKVGRLFVLTVRPRPSWEKSAEEQGGFGL